MRRDDGSNSTRMASAPARWIKYRRMLEGLEDSSAAEAGKEKDDERIAGEKMSRIAIADFSSGKSLNIDPK